MKRKNPETSLEAYKKLDPIRVSQTMNKIAQALVIIGKGNYEMIAEAAGMAEQKCWKRLIDCVRAGLIHRTDETKITKSGCKSYMYAIGPASQVANKRERVLKGRTVQDFSKAINQAKQSASSLERLF